MRKRFAKDVALAKVNLLAESHMGLFLNSVFAKADRTLDATSLSGRSDRISGLGSD